VDGGRAEGRVVAFPVGRAELHLQSRLEEASDQAGACQETLDDLRDQFEGVIVALAGLVRVWREDAERRRRSAERKAAFGPAQLLGVTEASMLAACADQVCDVIRVSAEG